MGGFNFLNLEYLLTRVFDFFGIFGLGDLASTVPSWLIFLAVQVAIWGTTLALVLLILVVYAQVRLIMVEHEGFHGREEHHAHEAQASAPPPQDERWRRIVELASSGRPGDWHRAILEADIMLSAVLDEAGYQGASVGDQLKMANPIQMTTLDLAWKAHKVRNQVAHGAAGFELTERDTRVAIDQYRRVFEEFGAI